MKKYFVGIKNLWIALLTKYMKLNVKMNISDFTIVH